MLLTNGSIHLLIQSVSEEHNKDGLHPSFSFFLYVFSFFLSPHFLFLLFSSLTIILSLSLSAQAFICCCSRPERACVKYSYFSEPCLFYSYFFLCLSLFSPLKENKLSCTLNIIIYVFSNILKLHSLSIS